jgi:prepilin-type N-terminal cleavage/methylation domain-containing protein
MLFNRMLFNNAAKARKSQRGFTLVELSVVIVVIGILAVFGVPQFKKAVERSKAAEAFNYLSAVRDAQERYASQKGTYASDLTLLDIQQPVPTYFTVGTPAAGSTSSLEDSWTLTLTRSGPSSGYGAYTVIFTDQGCDSTNSTICTDIAPNPSCATAACGGTTTTTGTGSSH